MFEIILILITGVATGFLNVMAGGGSMLSVPVMIFLGIPSTIANASNRIAILPQNITASITFYRQGISNLRQSLTLALCTIPGAIAGAYSATLLPHQDFDAILAIIMIFVLLIMCLPQSKEHKQSKLAEYKKPISRRRNLIGHALIIGVGFWGGFIQIGVGFLLIPILNKVLRFDLINTNMHKVFIVMSYTCVALMVFSSQLELVWSIGIALAVGASFGAWLATRFQIKRGINSIRWVLNAVIIVFIVKLLFFNTHNNHEQQTAWVNPFQAIQ